MEQYNTLYPRSNQNTSVRQTRKVLTSFVLFWIGVPVSSSRHPEGRLEKTVLTCDASPLSRWASSATTAAQKNCSKKRGSLVRFS